MWDGAGLLFSAEAQESAAVEGGKGVFLQADNFEAPAWLALKNMSPLNV